MSFYRPSDIRYDCLSCRRLTHRDQLLCILQLLYIHTSHLLQLGLNARPVYGERFKERS